MRIARVADAALSLSKRGEYIMIARNDTDAQLLMYLLYHEEADQELNTLIFGDEDKGNDGQY